MIYKFKNALDYIPPENNHLLGNVIIDENNDNLICTIYTDEITGKSWCEYSLIDETSIQL